MIFQTKYTFFNKKIKMLLLLFILMWSLMAQQNVNGKSSTYDIGIVKTAAGCAAPSAGKYFVYDTFGKEEMIQENITEITTANDKNQAVSSTSSITRTTTSTAAAETGGQCKNAAAATIIYDHFNENDNKSNKLRENVANADYQQPKMINVDRKMPVPLQLTSSSISKKSAGDTITTTAAASQTQAALKLLPKDQLSKIPHNNKSGKKHEIKPDDSKELNKLKVQFQNLNDRKSTFNMPNNANNNSINAAGKNDSINTTQQSNLPQKSKATKILKIKNLEINKTNSNKLKAFDSIAHARQKLIVQFALQFKQIPRVTYFTCNEPQKVHTNQSEKINGSDFKKRNMETVELLKRLYKSNIPNLMIKVVLIDHLLNKYNGGTGNILARERYRGTGGPAARNSLANANWLEESFSSDTLRQVIVLDLTCGLSSRRLLEMASNKAFFNSKYHWLLLEDYAFNRQTEIDDADDTSIESQLNNYTYHTQADKSFKEEIVNDSNTANLQVKKLFAYPADVDGVFTSGPSPRPGPDEQKNSTATNSTSSSSFKFATDKNRQQRWADGKTSSTTAFNASRAGITDEDDMEIIEKFLEKINININTELILAKRRVRLTTLPANSSAQQQPPSQADSASTVSNDYNTLRKMDYYLLYDVWSPGAQYGGVLNISKVGNFTRGQGLKLDKWFSTASTTRRRMNMHLARIRCMVVITHKNHSDTLEEYLTSHHDTHLDSMNRFNFALLTYVRDLFNFSFILSKTPTWGYLKNGKFDGMIGALVRKQADIGGSPIFFRIERAKVIDYTTRTWVARPCFIFRHPSSTKKDRIVFLQPFSNDVWIFLFASGCITIILLWLLTSLEHKFSARDFHSTHGKSPSTTTEKVATKQKSAVLAIIQKSIKSKKEKTGLFRKWLLLGRKENMKNFNSRQNFSLFFESFIFYIGAICQQGQSFSTFFFSGRCIVITSLLFSFAIYQFYSASIVGTLLMEKPKTIRTLRDLIRSSLEIGIEDIVYNRDYFLRTKDPDAQELYAKKISTEPPKEDTGFADAQNDKVALTTPRTELTDAQKAKVYRDILHSHETGAHAKTHEASKWYDPDYGVAKVKKGSFAFHVDVATAYKIIADTFNEREICDLSEIQLFPPQKMVSIVQKGSPLRKAITYGLRRVTEVGLTDYQRKVWHSPKPRCVKQIHTDDLRVDMQTFTSALLVLIFGYAVSLLVLSLENVLFKLRQRYTT